MNVQDASSAPLLRGTAAGRRPESPEEAARQFEEVLVRQFVETMTDGLFESGLSGDDGPGWMGAYGDMQKDTLTDVLTGHLVDSGSLRLRDLLLRQWGHGGATPVDDAAEPAPDETAPRETAPDETAPQRLPGDPSLRMA